MPAVMMFARSTNGLSHCKEEDTPEADLEVTIDAFLRLVDKTVAAVAARIDAGWRHAGGVTQSATMPSASSDRRGVVGLLVLLFAITYLDRVCISVAGPRMQEDLGIDPIGWGWVTGHVHPGLLPVRDSDRHDGRPHRPAARAHAHRGVVVGVHRPDRRDDQLLPAAAHHGSCSGRAKPARFRMRQWWCRAGSRREQRATMSGVNLMASQVGGAIAPLLVLPIQMRYGWRMSFYVFGVAGLVWAAVWYAWFRDSPEEKRGLGSSASADTVGAPAAPISRAMPSRGAWPPAPARCGRCSGWRSATSTSTTSSRRGFTRSWSGAGDSARPACSSRRCRSWSPRAPTSPEAPRATRWSGGSVRSAAGESSAPLRSPRRRRSPSRPCSRSIRCSPWSSWP